MCSGAQLAGGWSLGGAVEVGALTRQRWEAEQQAGEHLATLQARIIQLEGQVPHHTRTHHTTPHPYRYITLQKVENRVSDGHVASSAFTTTAKAFTNHVSDLGGKGKSNIKLATLTF